MFDRWKFIQHLKSPLLLTVGFLTCFFTPFSTKAQTAAGPEVILTPKRSEIVLSGQWKFQPAIGDSAKAPTADWGTIWVPGSWWPERNSFPTTSGKGTTEIWKSLNDSLATAWYEREFEVPASWAGRQIYLSFQRISTDALIYVNGQECNKVLWPFGEADISKAVTPGQKATVRILVSATLTEALDFDFMGVGQNTTVKAKLPSRGLIGDVILGSRPAWPRLESVYAMTSVRKKQLTLQLDFEKVTTPGEVKVIAHLENEKGVEEKKFEGTVTVRAAATQTVEVSWPWPDPRLWDLAQPNLYNLKLEVKGAGVDDSIAQRFGFREFWVEGRGFVLNGVPFRLRPWLMGTQYGAGNTQAQADAEVSRHLARQGNIAEIWPANMNKRGEIYNWHLFFEAADRQGLPLIAAPLARFNEYLYDKSYTVIWDKEGNREKWAALAALDWKRWRNHPSIVMASLWGNAGGHDHDQYPKNIGVRKFVPETDTKWWQVYRAQEEATKLFKQIDPARAVSSHMGWGSDVFSTNFYLNFIPLQEREEWMDWHVKHGDMPFLGVEVGTPLHSSFMRGRNGFGPTNTSEPLMTEFSAIYFGNKAYETEPAGYRRQVRSKYESGGKWQGWQSDQELETAAPFQAVQELFSRNTWRAWRTAGLEGGNIPWSDGHAWYDNRKEGFREMSEFVPGTLGPQLAKVPERSLQPAITSEYWNIQPGGKALLENNAATLAWITGSAAAWSAKDHHYRSGSIIEKQSVVINDLRAETDYQTSWTISLGGKELAKGEDKGKLKPATNLFAPIKATLPAVTQKTEGEIKLSATIGTIKHEDTFTFTVFPPAPALIAAATQVSIYDPNGKTTTALKALGVTTTPWDGQPAKNLLIIGTDALSSNAKLPGSFEDFVTAGGRLLVMAQQPDWMRSSWGFRVARHVSRRVFTINPSHPVVVGLTDENLRDWNGESALTEAYPMVDLGSPASYGWKWGNRGGVSSGAIEKPHKSGWRPILECEFDLAYSPLMELDRGSGKAILCTLDLEDHAALDPAAELLFRQLLSYAVTAPVLPRAAQVVYVGGEVGKKMLTEMSLDFTSSETLPTSPALIIIGENAAGVDGAVLESAAKQGSQILVLPRTTKVEEGQTHYGAKLKLVKNFFGSRQIPDQLLFAGLSRSDLRWRSDADHRIVMEGAEPLADGLFGVKTVDRGQIVYSQVGPNIHDAAKLEYFRFTRWRQTRALSQVLANLGATFKPDDRFFNPRLLRLSLAGSWKVKFTTTLPNQEWKTPNEDPGISEVAKAAVAETYDDSAWETFNLPGYHPQWEKQDGEGVFRRTVELPENWAGQIVRLHAGRIDNFDTVYVNGTAVGSTDKTTKDAWNLPRQYRVSGDLIKAGKNTIAIRVFDADSGSGIHGRKDEMYLQLLSTAKVPPNYYHADYREDFEFGDDPYRYYRW